MNFDPDIVEYIRGNSDVENKKPKRNYRIHEKVVKKDKKIFNEKYLFCFTFKFNLTMKRACFLKVNVRNYKNQIISCNSFM